MSCGDTSLFRNTDVPYFTLRNWVREGRAKKMTAAELFECRNVELVALVLKLRVKCGALATANHLLKTKINVFGVTADWKRVTEENKNKLLNAIRCAREVDFRNYHQTAK